MKGLIISSGDIKDLKRLKELTYGIDTIICADGGIRYAMKIDIVPDAIIGDLDSIDMGSRKFIEENNIRVIKFPVEKDETDTELALMYLCSQGCGDIILTGVTGTRIDHTLGNIFLLKKLQSEGVNGKIIDDKNTIYYVNNYLKLAKRKDYFISIIPITMDGAVVTLNGFYYSLNNSLVDFSSTLGISNKIVEEYGEIKIIRGEVLIIESKD